MTDDTVVIPPPADDGRRYRSIFRWEPREKPTDTMWLSSIQLIWNDRGLSWAFPDDTTSGFRGSNTARRPSFVPTATLSPAGLKANRYTYAIRNQIGYNNKVSKKRHTEGAGTSTTLTSSPLERSQKRMWACP